MRIVDLILFWFLALPSYWPLAIVLMLILSAFALGCLAGRRL